MKAIARVDIDVHHVMHRSGAMEASEHKEEVRDEQRVGVFLTRLADLASEYGFLVDDAHVVESWAGNKRRGHWPIIEVVLTQVPAGLRDKIAETPRTESSAQFQSEAKGNDQWNTVTGSEPWWNQERGV